MLRVLSVALVAAMMLSGCAKAPAADVSSAFDGTDVSGDDLENATLGNATLEEIAPALPWYPNDGTAILEDVSLPSFDGHKIPLTIHKPAIANATQKVPVLIHSHGFGGVHTSTDVFTDYIAAGFGVVSFTQRGHGDAQDEPVTFMQPAIEVMDTKAVIDMIAGLDWVLMENETTKDPVLGGIGYSYGGAFQTMGAIFDDRFDAIVPEITWNRIDEALAPNGAIKSSWVDAFYGSGNGQGTVKFSDDFHAGFAWATATNELPAGQAPGVPDLVGDFIAASPATYPGELDIPTLFLQGMKDTLFPLNHAVANYQLVQDTGAPVALYTHLQGHMFHTDGSLPSSPVPFGLQSAPGGTPCGDATEIGIAWHQHYLLGLDTWNGPDVCISFEDKTTVTGTQWPINGTEIRTIDLGGPWPLPQAPLGADVPITIDLDGTIVGIPKLSGKITAEADAIVYASLQMPDRSTDPIGQVVDDQAMPYRVKGPALGQAFSYELGGVAVQIDGQTLELHLSNWAPEYFGNAERIPGAVVLDDLVLEVPVLS